MTIKTGIVAADGREEVLSEFICDWPGCPNVAEHILGVVVEFRMMAAMCSEHAAMMKKRASKPGAD